MKIQVSIQGELSTNSYMITDGKGCFIIDPVENGIETREQLAKENIEIYGVILTHFHLDHLKAIGDYRDCKIYISTKDYQNITTPNAIYFMRTAFYSPDFMTKNEEERISHVLKSGRIVKVDDKQIIPFSEKLEVILTPGHTDGSMCIYAPNSAALFSGDTLFYHSHGRTDLETASPKDMLLSLKKLSKLPKNTSVYPGHGGITSIDEELTNGVLKRFDDA